MKKLRAFCLLSRGMGSLATKIRSKRYQVDATIQQCRAYLFKGDLEKAQETEIQSIEVSKEIGYQYGEARALGVVAVFYKFPGDPLQAIEYHITSYEVAKKEQEDSLNSSIMGEIKSWSLKKNIIDAHNNLLGEIYRDIGAYPQGPRLL